MTQPSPSKAVKSGTDANGWLGIESAPKDGNEVLGFWSYLYVDDKTPTTGMDIIRWERTAIPGLDAEGWVDSEGLCSPGVFTHWQPLPGPPVAPPSIDGED
ncbi:hypothetical protein C8D77_111163 [Mesorhizobium loti]|uniref:DUF551 domain-containing protein n=1 Tax=Rhizobium loti TaxID=381 RepID=A0A8E2WAV8_RHILI|nr:hypothetical protein [Mesorhizobium loti]PWJ88440.1 hypothetical protein C8D77_111163 [Mesorhizobium loti]